MLSTPRDASRPRAGVPTLARAFAAFAVAVGLLTTLTSAPAQAATAREEYELAAHRTTNEVRVDRDLVALTESACLQTFADRQATRMANQERIFHQDLEPILDECRLSMTGENVAVGYPTGRSVVLDGWMESEPHRLNLLRPRYRQMAIAARRGEDGRWYVSQVFGRRL